jgi:hypothetical protein
MIRKKGRYWVVYDRQGRKVSKHRSQAAAEAKSYRLGMRRRARVEYVYYDRPSRVRHPPEGYHYTRTGELRRNRRRSKWASAAPD